MTDAPEQADDVRKDDPPLLIMTYPHSGGWHNSNYVPDSHILKAEAERDKWKEIAGTWADKWKVADAERDAAEKIVKETARLREAIRNNDGANIVDFYDVWLNQERVANTKLKAERDTLAAQVVTLTPLARLGLMARDMAFDDAYLSDTMARSMFIGRIQCFVDDNQMTLNDDTDPPTIAAARTILEANDV